MGLGQSTQTFQELTESVVKAAKSKVDTEGLSWGGYYKVSNLS